VSRTTILATLVLAASARGEEADSPADLTSKLEAVRATHDLPALDTTGVRRLGDEDLNELMRGIDHGEWRIPTRDLRGTECERQRDWSRPS